MKSFNPRTPTMADVGDLVPTRPIEEVPGGLAYYIYGQDGKLVRMTCKDTPHLRRFIVWLRKFDRYGEGAEESALTSIVQGEGE